MFIATILAAPLILAPFLQKAEPDVPAAAYYRLAPMDKAALPKREELLKAWGLSDVA